MLFDAGHFERSYDADIIDAPGGTDSDFEFTCRAKNGPVTTVLVHPIDAAAWTGSFMSDGSWRGVRGIFETPSATWFCFIDRGTAFLVDVLNPRRSTYLATDGPVRFVVPLPQEGLLLLGTPWAITAVGAGVTLWTTERISVESLRIDEVVGHHVLGVADPDDDEPREFAVDLRSGALQGGSGLS